MEPINKAQRTTSLINFTAVYLIAIAIPVFIAFFAGSRRNAGAATSSTIKEYEALEAEMTEMQKYMTTMRELDEKSANMNAPEQWQQWLRDAKQENARFESAIGKFEKQKFTGARTKMQNSIATYLYQLHTERVLHLKYLESVHGKADQSASIEQLKLEKQQLQNEKQQLQNTVNMQNAMLAQKPAGGGGGGSGGQENQVLTDLKWQLRFEDADCKKSQADILAAYNESAKRKQLYSSAKVNFQQIVQLARNSAMIQRQASLKVKEIDQTLSRL